MSWKFGRIKTWTAELAALDQFKNLLLENYSKYLMTCCQVSDRCPFGYLFVFLKKINCAFFVSMNDLVYDVETKHGLI